MYFSIFIACILLIWACRYEHKRVVLQFDFIVLFLFSALRYNFGNDYSNYHRFFEDVHRGAEYLEIKEIGYYWINRMAPNFYLLIALMSAVFLIMVYRMVVNNLEPEEYPYALFVFLIDPYVFLMFQSMIRQNLAIGLFLFALEAADKKKPHLYFLLCFAAFLIHTSAIILIPFYFLFNNKRDVFTKPRELLLLIAAVFVGNGVIVSPIIQVVLRIFNNKNYYYYFNTVSTNSLRATILTSISLVYICINLRKLSDRRLAYGKISIFAYLCDFFAFYYAMISRIGAYFSVFRLISLPAIFMTNYKNAKGMDRLINVYLLPSLIVLIYLLRIYSFFTNPMWESFLHYHTFLDL